MVDRNDTAAREAYYAALPRETSYAGVCEMQLPCNLVGKRVLDLGCRSGKGAFKIAERTGVDGFVLGVDPSPSYLERACARVEGAATQEPELAQRLKFACGCFEDLREAGVADASFDVVIVNSVLNLARDREGALGEIARVLVPGGLLYHAGLFAETSCEPSLSRAFAAQGNVFGAARTCAAFKHSVLHAGFLQCSFELGEPVVPKGSEAVDALRGSAFYAAVVSACK